MFSKFTIALLTTASAVSLDTSTKSMKDYGIDMSAQNYAIDKTKTAIGASKLEIER